MYINNTTNNNVTNEFDNNTNTNNSIVNTNKNVNSNTSNSLVPFTGVKVGLGTALFVALIAAAAAGVRYKKYNSIK